MTIREQMIDYLVTTGYGKYDHPTQEEIWRRKTAYIGTSDQDIFDEYASDRYKEGQESMSRY